MTTGLNGLQSSVVGIVSAVPLLAFGTSCQVDEDGDGFRVTNVDFDGESAITLTFSQPVGDLSDVDPGSFRLSFATTYAFEYTSEEFTTYNDLGLFISSAGYYETEMVTVSSLMAGSSADRIVLQTSHAWGAEVCQLIAEMQAMFEMYEMYEGSGYQADVAIFVHYAAGDVPLESASGSPLAEIGADWVIGADLYQVVDGYGFRRLTPQLRIPCP